MATLPAALLTPAFAVAAFAVVAACGLGAGGPGSRQPAPAESTPAPSLGDGPPDATSERDGIVVELWLDRASVEPGGRIQALVRVRNDGDRIVYREANDCGGGPAPVTVAAGSGLPAGRQWTGLAARFKREVLAQSAVHGDGDAVLAGFRDASTIDTPNAACPAYSEIRPFSPGDVAERRLAWDARAPEGTAIAAGPAKATARFEAWETFEAAQASGDGPTFAISATATIEIAGDAGAQPTIVEYVDAALAEPRFAAWLEEQPASTWINPNVVFWPNDEGEYPRDPRYREATDGAVDIGLFRYAAESESYGAVTLDVPTAEVLGVEFGP